MALAAELAPPVVAEATEPADPGLLLAELTAIPPPLPSDEDAAIEDAMAAAEAAARDVATDDGTTPNTDAGELY